MHIHIIIDVFNMETVGSCMSRFTARKLFAYDHAQAIRQRRCGHESSFSPLFLCSKGFSGCGQSIAVILSESMPL